MKTRTRERQKRSQRRTLVTSSSSMLALACSLFLFVSLSLVRLLHVDSRPKRALKSYVPLRLFQLSLVFLISSFFSINFFASRSFFLLLSEKKRVQITFYQESGRFRVFLKRSSRSSIKRPVEIRTARFQIWKCHGKLSERSLTREERERERGKVVGAAVTSAYPAQDRETTGVSEFYLFHNCIRCLLALGLKIQERQFPPSFHFRLVQTSQL